jgi:subtilase family serine protease
MIGRSGVCGLALSAVLALASIASAAPQPLLTRHTRGEVVNGEVQSVGRMPATQTMKFDIVLALRHAPELENFLADVYDPSSRNYRHFLTPTEFTARFGASREDWNELVQFAKQSGFAIIGGSREGSDLQLKGNVSQVEKAFHVEMGIYQHPTENRQFFAPDREPTVDLSFQLWHITGLNNYSLPHTALIRKDPKVNPNGAQATTGSCPGASFCGSDMRAAYYEATSLTGAGQNIGLLELAGTDLVDLTTYYSGAKQKEPFTPTILSTGGYSTTCVASSGCDDTEQTLDMTQAMGMAPGANMLYMYVCGDAYGSGTFSETACYASMVTDKQAPLSLQISSSWGWKPDDPATDDPYFEQMAAQGQSFFDAAGDSDKWEAGGYNYPAEDPNIICVGGTDLTTKGAGEGWSSEVGWADGGGGISPDQLPIPAYQQLAGVITAKNEGSTKYRNGPDVSANSNFTFYVCADQSGLSGCTENDYGGTSFAAPMWAGYLALANQQAVANGSAAPGFINPAVYALGLSSGYGAAFHDITSGNNGFPAEVGYDLDTGWGSPNGAGLINALTSGGGGGGGTLSFAPASLKWGKIAVGTTAAGKKKVVVTNTGSSSVSISTIAVTGNFALVSVTKTKKVTPCTNGISLAAGSTCEIKVSFTPESVGALTGDVTFTDNANGSPQEVALSGTGK